MGQAPVAWTVTEYSNDGLCLALASASGVEAAFVRGKEHFEYFCEYFAKVGVRSIVVEHHYVDRDFLEDFAAYYVRCFETYQRTCVRLHFFRQAFTPTDFASILEGALPEQRSAIAQSYVGFIVAKPLPQTIVGRTCLITYDDDNGRRHFPITRRYDANLFGLQLSIKTLAFQEQDRVAAACATSALWSAFHGTGVLFQHHIPSPVEITHSATQQGLLDSRALPSAGLNQIHMANAIRQVGLEPLLLAAGDEWDLKGTCYAYASGGVPTLLLGELIETATPPGRALGLHAVTVTGYSLGLAAATPAGPTGFLLRASRIDKVYGHDDQVGPFARMEADGKDPKFSLSTSWLGETGARGSVRFAPSHLMIPLYHKVRIPYASVLEDTMQFDALLQQLVALSKVPLPRLEWDISLCTVNGLKREIIDSSLLKPAQRRNLLERSMPKFLWRARGRFVDGTADAVDVLFDATGIELGNYCFCVLEPDSRIGTLLRSIWNKNPALHQTLQANRSWQVLARVVL